MTLEEKSGSLDRSTARDGFGTVVVMLGMPATPDPCALQLDGLAVFRMRSTEVLY